MKYNLNFFEKNAIVRFLALDKYIIEEKIIVISQLIMSIKNFNKFFMIRRDEKWREIYYTYFEKMKNNTNISFEEIIKYMYSKIGNIDQVKC